jgi:hypothetical protein
MKTNHYTVTCAYKHSWEALNVLHHATSKAEASRVAAQHRASGCRALVHDRQTGIIIQDTGKPYGQVWAGASRKGQRSPLPVLTTATTNGEK